MFTDAFHAARLVALESALRSVLADAQAESPFDDPDAIRVTFSPAEGVQVEYLRGGVAVGGEGL